MPLELSLPDRFADQMGALLGPDFPTELGLAVSGGGDSMAMLHLAAGWARRFGVYLRVATVDHGLRPESAAEAALVADEARGLELAHDTLPWRDRPEGNLQDAARVARYRLLAEWMGQTSHLLLAHTADDQAETLLMRLARGSGVDGLAAMRPVTGRNGMTLVRPLLRERRATLHHYLDVLRIPYADDPSNVDPQFARVRMRHLIGREGLDVATLTATATRMARAQEALAIRARTVAQSLIRDEEPGTGVIVLDRDGFATTEAETQMRILAAALQAVSGSGYRPRETPLDAARETLVAGGTATLHGGLMMARGDRIYLGREPKAVAALRLSSAERAVWDIGWQFGASEADPAEIRALGAEGLQHLRDAGAALPEGSRLPAILWQSQPALWQGERLFAFAPAQFGPAYMVTPPDTCGICLHILKPH